MLVIIEKNEKKPLINVYIKISRNLGGNFWNLGSNFLHFFAIFLATFRHSSEQLSRILRAQSEKVYWRPTSLTIHSKLFEKT